MFFCMSLRIRTNEEVSEAPSNFIMNQVSPFHHDRLSVQLLENIFSMFDFIWDQNGFSCVALNVIDINATSAVCCCALCCCGASRLLFSSHPNLLFVVTIVIMVVVVFIIIVVIFMSRFLCLFYCFAVVGLRKSSHFQWAFLSTSSQRNRPLLRFKESQILARVHVDLAVGTIWLSWAFYILLHTHLSSSNTKRKTTTTQTHTHTLSLAHKYSMNFHLM